MFLDATYCKARVNHRVVSQAIVVGIGVTADGRREVLGMDVGDSEDGAFCTAFLRGLKTNWLAGTQLVISDAHSGLKQAIAAVFIGSAWQRSSVNICIGGMFPLVAGRDWPVGVVPRAPG